MYLHKTPIWNDATTALPVVSGGMLGTRELSGKSPGAATKRVNLSAMSLALAVSISLVATAASADTGKSTQPLTIDDLGFSGVMNDQLFSSRFKISNETAAPISGSSNSASAAIAGVKLRSMMEFDSDHQSPRSNGIGLDLNQDELASSDGIQIKRFSTSVESSAGTLTVGNDWSNFQDFLGSGQSVLDASDSVALGAATANQISWNSPNGLGVAIEQSVNGGSGNLVGGEDGAPSLVLSWEGESRSGRGQYRMSALGRQVDTDAAENDQKDVGWGLNLAGGWRFGDLFARLSLTLGNSIDSFILGRFADDETKDQPANNFGLNEAFSISPGIDYRLTEKGNIHFSVNRFQSAEDDPAHGIDTLDTVHLGYTWNPWPSTKIGVEFVGKDMEGRTDTENSSEVNFAASKQF